MQPLFRSFNMLVLSRREGQAVRVGEAVITVTKIGDGSVKLGFVAPLTTKVLRTELDDRPGKKPAA
jgi:carbon storage regulator CsrA